MANISHELVPMKAGDGPQSYTQNSSHQRGGVDRTKEMIAEAIADKLDIDHTCSTGPLITIADFGCSTGPNTFLVVDNVIEAVELKYKQQCPSRVPEFQAYFNDHLGNDFNTLFNSIPIQQKTPYFAAGVPGSFYGRLFPKASLTFVNSSYALQWLSMVPTEVQDKKSPAWNKGRITFANSPKSVVEAYSAQYQKDMGSFLHARAEELQPGGLMSLLIIASPDEILPSQRIFLGLVDLMGCSLVDMANEGIINEAEVDSFNMPVYNTTYQEFKSLIDRNGFFSVEKMEPLFRGGPNAETCATHLRAGGFEEVVREHFGSSIINDLFQRFAKKIAESYNLSSAKAIGQASNELYVLLKRKSY